MEVNHKNYVISYREDSNDWFNTEIGIKPSLAAAKKAIDDLMRKSRRADIKALMIYEPYWRSSDDCKIIEVKVGAMAEPRGRGPITEAHISYEKGKNINREKVSLDRLYPLDHRPRLEKYLALKATARAAERAADDYKEGLVGFNAETIKAAKEAETKEEVK